jgi:hypothetical protein
MRLLDSCGSLPAALSSVIVPYRCRCGIIPLVRLAVRPQLEQARSESHMPSYETRAERRSGRPNFGVAQGYPEPRISQYRAS